MWYTAVQGREGVGGKGSWGPWTWVVLFRFVLSKNKQPVGCLLYRSFGWIRPVEIAKRLHSVHPAQPLGTGSICLFSRYRSSHMLCFRTFVMLSLSGKMFPPFSQSARPRSCLPGSGIYVVVGTSAACFSRSARSADSICLARQGGSQNEFCLRYKTH